VDADGHHYAGLTVDAINSGSNASVTVSFLDEAGVAETPTEVRWSVLDATPSNAGAVLRGDTLVSGALGPSVTLPLTPDDTAVTDPSEEFNYRTVLVKARYDGGTQIAVFKMVLDILVMPAWPT